MQKETWKIDPEDIIVIHAHNKRKYKDDLYECEIIKRGISLGMATLTDYLYNKWSGGEPIYINESYFIDQTK